MHVLNSPDVLHKLLVPLKGFLLLRRAGKVLHQRSIRCLAWTFMARLAASQAAPSVMRKMVRCGIDVILICAAVVAVLNYKPGRSLCDAELLRC